MPVMQGRTGEAGMSKRHQVKPVEQKQVAQPSAPKTKSVTEPDLSIGLASAPSPKDVEWFRRCPLCWGRCKGVGKAYSKNGCTRYYRCAKTLTDEAPCGHTWSAIVRTEVVRVEHRVVSLDER